jgi:hypothetical protein
MFGEESFLFVKPREDDQIFTSKYNAYNTRAIAITSKNKVLVVKPSEIKLNEISFKKIN